MNVNQSFYQILGVNLESTIDEIKDAYKKMVKQWHPDLFFGQSEETIEQANIIMAKINEAYTTIAKAYYERQASLTATASTQTTSTESTNASQSQSRYKEDESRNARNQYQSFHERTQRVYVHIVSDIFDEAVFYILTDYMDQIYNDIDFSIIKEYYYDNFDKYEEYIPPRSIENNIPMEKYRSK